MCMYVWRWNKNRYLHACTRLIDDPISQISFCWIILIETAFSYLRFFAFILYCYCNMLFITDYTRIRFDIGKLIMKMIWNFLNSTCAKSNSIKWQCNLSQMTHFLYYYLDFIQFEIRKPLLHLQIHRLNRPCNLKTSSLAFCVNAFKSMRYWDNAI